MSGVAQLTPLGMATQHARPGTNVEHVRAVVQTTSAHQPCLFDAISSSVFGVAGDAMVRGTPWREARKSCTVIVELKKYLKEGCGTTY